MFNVETSEVILESRTPSAVVARLTSSAKSDVRTPSAAVARLTSEAKSVVSTPSAAVARLTSESICPLRSAETEAKFVEAEPANDVIAPLMSLSADWKAVTISLNELRAVASTLLRTLSTRVLTAAMSLVNEAETETISECNAPSAAVARLTSESSCPLRSAETEAIVELIAESAAARSAASSLIIPSSVEETV